MKRTRAAALAIINWRGVFYERYLLDPSVTALEGANGSGKTTVLIAAYLVMLPDMTRLRFTSLAEHAGAASDKGIWGRLGQPGRPSYAVMDLRHPSGERLIAGVHLERRSEPIIEATTFLITGLADNMALQDVLLVRGEVDSVPELNQLRSQVARFGGRFHTYSTVKEYFAALFEYGITPLRLSTDEERSKLNEMLRTSMMGGISRALTSDFRDFLLKEETGLADTLKRMRANLDACRRTRTEVSESRNLEQEISAVYEAGQDMFAAAVHATRERAQELQGRVQEARHSVHKAETNLSTLSSQYDEAKTNLNQITQQLHEIGQSLETNRELLRRLLQARMVADRIRDREASLAQAKRDLSHSKSVQDSSERLRDAAIEERDAAQNARERAAEGLADFTKGLEELERRAAEHQLVTDQFSRAKRFFVDLDSSSERLAQTIEDCEKRRSAANSEFISLDRFLSTSLEKRIEHDQVLAALQALHDEPVSADRAFEYARADLAHLRRLEILVEQSEPLSAEIKKTSELADRQRRLKDAVATLEMEGIHLSCQLDVERELTACESKLGLLEQQLLGEDKMREDGIRLLQAKRDLIIALENGLIQWRTIAAWITALEEEWKCRIRASEEVLKLRNKIALLRDDERLRLLEPERKRDNLTAEAISLEQSGGVFPPDLLKVRDTVGGELLASRFEEIDPNDAPAIQALLGPLAEAIVVEDPVTASTAIAKVSEKPDTVWLVGGDAKLQFDEEGRPVGEIVDGNVLVTSENSGWRISRIPDRAILGRRARERHVLQLRQQSAAAALEVEAHKERLDQLERYLDTTDRLLSAGELLIKGDPSGELETARQTAMETERIIEHHQEIRNKIAADIKEVRPLGLDLRNLLPLAWLLDQPEYSARVKELRSQLESAKAAAAHLEDVHTHRILLEQKLDALRQPPPSDEEIAGLEMQRTSVETLQGTLTELLMSLRYVSQHRIALDWTDAEVSLREKKDLVPALKEQLELAKNAAIAAEEKLKKMDAELQWAVSNVNENRAKVRSLEEALELDRAEWLRLGIEDASDAVQSVVTERICEAEAEKTRLQGKNKEVTRQVNHLELLHSQAEEGLRAARTHLGEQERAWKPEQERWQRLQAAAAEHGLLAAALTQRFTELFLGQGSPNLRQKAREHATALKERLARARDVEQVQKAVEELLGPQELSGETYLQAWVEVRNWLRRRMPAQISQVDEPLQALGRLREHLASLESRLHHQETELRGESEDIARNIDIHIRRAQREINRLNFDLEKVRLGSIQGVRLHLQRVDKMDQVLSALREGQAQELLFTPEMPIEEALDEIFRRFAGGRTGGQRLLDYREYLDPRITVKRKGSEEWEIVNANRLSTGEGIGIGAAVMMVVLAGWERDANLLRPKRSYGTLRLLFLDEANRLDKQNLGVLFDLCQSLELQLIVAAPEVARAEGNTTYRLIRRLDSNGREEVIVSGRRAAPAGATV